MSVVFIGNFVNDLIVRIVGKEERTTKATGGSVTYGSLAAVAFGCSPSPQIISKAGSDLSSDFLDLLKSKGVPLDSIAIGEGKNTSYKLHYDEKKSRTLSLKEKGYSILPSDVITHIGKPEAIFFVPVAAEFSEDLVIDVMQHLHHAHQSDGPYHPIVALDVQGFVRNFAGSRVITNSQEDMINKFDKLASTVNKSNFTILKAEYAEAVVIVGPLSPPECGKALRSRFGFSIVSVTMGHLGSYVSSDVTGEVYIPTFKPQEALDETGCGDTFLTCVVLELLLRKRNQAGNIVSDTVLTKDDVIQAMLVGSAAASYLVEKIGPAGFASREQILERVNSGERTQEKLAEEKAAEMYSLTIYKKRKS